MILVINNRKKFIRLYEFYTKFLIKVILFIGNDSNYDVNILWIELR